jgi:hypothetical protein
MAQGRCAATGCGRFAGRGETFCRRHREEDEASGRAPPGVEVGGDGGRAADFRERLAGGDYRALLGPGVWSAIAQAGAAADLRGEIGLLRVVLARLLLEEDDPARLAQGTARVAGALVQAARAQHALSGDSADGLTDAVTRILAELG